MCRIWGPAFGFFSCSFGSPLGLSPRSAPRVRASFFCCGGVCYAFLFSCLPSPCCGVLCCRSCGGSCRSCCCSCGSCGGSCCPGLRGSLRRPGGPCVAVWLSCLGRSCWPCRWVPFRRLGSCSSAGVGLRPPSGCFASRGRPVLGLLRPSCGGLRLGVLSSRRPPFRRALLLRRSSWLGTSRLVRRCPACLTLCSRFCGGLGGLLPLPGVVLQGPFWALTLRLLVASL